MSSHTHGHVCMDLLIWHVFCLSVNLLYVSSCPSYCFHIPLKKLWAHGNLGTRVHSQLKSKIKASGPVRAPNLECL